MQNENNTTEGSEDQAKEIKKKRQELSMSPGLTLFFW